MKTETIDAVSDAIRGALWTWTDADWTHENGPEMCEGGDPDCETCIQAEQDAAAANAQGERALALLDAGDLWGAWQALEEAVRIESSWGDAPTWKPVRDRAREAFRASQDASEDEVSE
jgi:hypothetical protein